MTESEEVTLEARIADLVAENQRLRDVLLREQQAWDCINNLYLCHQCQPKLESATLGQEEGDDD